MWESTIPLEGNELVGASPCSIQEGGTPRGCKTHGALWPDGFKWCNAVEERLRLRYGVRKP